MPIQSDCGIGKPAYCVMTNFSPWKEKREEHPWSGADRDYIAEQMLKEIV